MAPQDGGIYHVSDTALMVAACRALETDSPDGLVRDPFAAELAGERGMAIARAVPGLETLRFGVGIRSRFLDEIVAQATADAGIATVLALGAGLDTRPWRLDLRPDLRWIEVDFQAMLDYKSAAMAAHQPKCRLERQAADLNDASARAAVFAAVGEAPALMITEGLLMYLPAETIEALATEPARLSGIRHWLLDLTTPELGKRVGMDRRQAVQHVRAPNHLNGTQILKLLDRTGWISRQRRTYTRDAWAVARDRILARSAAAAAAAGEAYQPPVPPPTDDPSGVHLFARD
jgi:methyltransferase (TIGR00027 family)